MNSDTGINRLLFYFDGHSYDETTKQHSFHHKNQTKSKPFKQNLKSKYMMMRPPYLLRMKAALSSQHSIQLFSHRNMNNGTLISP